MANVQQGFGNSLSDAYFAFPPVTRYFATASLGLTALVNFKIISPYTIYLSWPLILKLQVHTEVRYCCLSCLWYCHCGCLTILCATGLAPRHSFLLPGWIQFQSFNTAGLAVSKSYAMCSITAAASACMHASCHSYMHLNSCCLAG